MVRQETAFITLTSLCAAIALTITLFAIASPRPPSPATIAEQQHKRDAQAELGRAANAELAREQAEIKRWRENMRDWCDRQGPDWYIDHYGLCRPHINSNKIVTLPSGTVLFLP